MKHKSISIVYSLYSLWHEIEVFIIPILVNEQRELIKNVVYLFIADNYPIKRKSEAVHQKYGVYPL